MSITKLTALIVLAICLGWSSNASVQTNDEPPHDKNASADLPVKIEPYSTIDSYSRAPSGTARSDATYAYEDFSYQWIDTSAGTVIPMLDDTYALSIPIGFSFPFHGIGQTTVNISANGFLSFYAPPNLYFTNDTMPSGGQPNGIIAPFWDDLRPEDAGVVTYLTQGIAGRRTFTITWAGVPHFSVAGDVGAVTFQVTLHEITGDIVFRYQDVLFEDPLFDNGASATIGVENGRGSMATVFSVNSPGIDNNDALRFYPLEANRTYDIGPEIFSWIDATTGQSHALDDDDGVTVPLGFDFPFFGTDYDLIRLGSNGYLTFGDSPLEYTGQFLPDDLGSPPVNSVIAPLWDDLAPSTAGSVFVLSQGVAPDRLITFSWNGVPHFASTGAVTFQATLHENGDVLFSYQDVDFSSPGLDNGGIASVGLEDAYGKSAAQYSFRQTSLNDGQTLRFSASANQPVPGAAGGGSFVINFGGRLLSWGGNFNGILGDLTTTSRHTPGYVVDQSGTPLDGIVALASGEAPHMLALDRSGKVYAWGDNTNNSLGDTGPSRNFAASVTGVTTAVGIATGNGGGHSLALLADGTVLGWGFGGDGQLGPGGSRSSPELVLDGSGGLPLNNVIAVAAGSLHSVVLRDDGSILAFGGQWNGALGNGNTTGSTSVPGPVIDEIGQPICCATQITVGDNHTLALMEDGSVLAWGKNLSGQLGDNSTMNRAHPVTVVDGAGAPIQATSVIAAGSHSFALQSSGQVLSWGGNIYGQLGDGSQINRSFAEPVLDFTGSPLQAVSSLASSWDYVIARQNNRSIWVWGSNSAGQLGLDSGDIASAFQATPIQLSTDLSVTQAAPAVVATGAAFSVGATVDNLGPIDALGVSLTQTFPLEFSILDVPNNCHVDGQTVRCLIGLLQANEQSGLEFLLTSSDEGSYTSSSEVSAQQADAVSGNNFSTAPTQIASGDDCEPDNILTQAQFVSDCATHSFFPAGDVDWVQFYSDGLVCDPLDTNCTGVNRGFPPRTSQFAVSITGISGVNPSQISVEIFDVNNQPIINEFNGCFINGNTITCDVEGYEGQVYVKLTNLSDEFGPDVGYSIDVRRISPGDEYYIDPDMFIDLVALASMQLEAWVRLTDSAGNELDTVQYDNILSVGSDTGSFRLELWVTNPAGLTCANSPNDCIYTTASFNIDMEDAWDWDDTCCYINRTIAFPDVDEDGIPDAIDNDNDNDGIDDILDNCVATSNATQANHDGDSLGDACDTDDDGDGVADDVDNCPLVPNTIQDDSNLNNIGDACDGSTEVALCSVVSTPVPPDFVLEQMATMPDAIQNLRVQIQARHTYVGDLVMTLEHQNTGTTIVLLDRPGLPLIDPIDGCSSDDIELILDDAAATLAEDQCAVTPPAIGGIHAPNNSLSAFNGESAAGTWRLGVADAFPAGDDGTLDGWCLFALVSDVDNDGIPDSADDDSDNDGIVDLSDNCPLTANSDQLNTDGDALGNACDPDDDDDTILDGPDNCPLDANTDQLNTDGDALGDVCDTDDDNDTVADTADNCPLTTNTTQLNSDTDNLGDACDNCTLVDNDDQRDTNADGYGNICDADFTNQGIVNFLDLDLMKDAFFSNPASPTWDPDLDLNGDDSINFNDLFIMQDQFFGPPGPSGLAP